MKTKTSKLETRKVIKTGFSVAAKLGSGFLLGAIGGGLVRGLNCNMIVKGLASIGWLGLTYKISEEAGNGMETYVDDVFELVDMVKNGEEPKIVRV